MDNDELLDLAGDIGIGIDDLKTAVDDAEADMRECCAKMCGIFTDAKKVRADVDKLLQELPSQEQVEE